MKLTEITIAGVDVEVRVGESTGQFGIYVGDERLGIGDSLEQAKDAARRSLAKRKVRVRVPFKTKGNERGVATGIHAGNNKVTATVTRKRYTSSTPHEENDQVEQYAKVFAPDTPDEVFAEIERLTNEVRDRQRQIRELEDEHQFILGAVVKQAIEAETERAVAR